MYYTIKELGIARSFRGRRAGSHTFKKITGHVSCAKSGSASDVNVSLSNIKPENDIDLSNTQLKWMCFNVQSCRQIATDICELVVDNDLDIVMLTETWLYEKGDEAYISAMTPAEYDCHSFPR